MNQAAVKTDNSKIKQLNFHHVNFILQELYNLPPDAKVLLLTLDSLSYNTLNPSKSWWSSENLRKMCNLSKNKFFNARFILEQACLISVINYYDKKTKRIKNNYTICREKFLKENIVMLNQMIADAVQSRKQQTKRKNDIEGLKDSKLSTKTGPIPSVETGPSPSVKTPTQSQRQGCNNTNFINNKKIIIKKQKFFEIVNKSNLQDFSNVINIHDYPSSKPQDINYSDTVKQLVDDFYTSLKDQGRNGKWQNISQKQKTKDMSVFQSLIDGTYVSKDGEIKNSNRYTFEDLLLVFKWCHGRNDGIFKYTHTVYQFAYHLTKLKNEYDKAHPYLVLDRYTSTEG